MHETTTMSTTTMEKYHIISRFEYGEEDEDAMMWSGTKVLFFIGMGLIILSHYMLVSVYFNVCDHQIFISLYIKLQIYSFNIGREGPFHAQLEAENRQDLGLTVM